MDAANPPAVSTYMIEYASPAGELPASIFQHV
jgi:hypothetical protein